MSWNNRNQSGNDQRGQSYGNGAGQGDNRKPATTIMMYAEHSNEDVAFINSYDTPYGRKSIISICRLQGETAGCPRFVELKRIKDVEPAIALQSAKTLLAQMGNGGGQDEL
jgi:hypothetical protein